MEVLDVTGATDFRETLADVMTSPAVTATPATPYKSLGVRSRLRYRRDDLDDSRHVCEARVS